MHEVPGFLASQIGTGDAVLVLGAGSALCAKDRLGKSPPSTSDLTSRICDKFLSGKYKDSPLSQASEYAISESSLSAVQDFIAEIFEPFAPSPAHLLLPTFRWRGIATTNYDRLVEKAYEHCAERVQSLRAFVENGDSVDDAQRDPQSVILLKLHGCITRTNSIQCPLILTTDQYVEYRRGRSRLFEHLQDWARERPLVFVGHSLQDPDLRAILLELAVLHERRPRYYAVIPHFDDVQMRFWESKHKVSLLKATFEDFMQTLSAALPSPFRGLAPTVADLPHPIATRFCSGSRRLSRAAAHFLERDVEYVKGVTATRTAQPSRFYKGFDEGWSAIEQNLDVGRSLADTILSDIFLAEDDERPRGVQLVLLKAHAGAGKTVLLRRVAWDAAHQYDRVCLYVREYGVLMAAPLRELIASCGERVYVFVDDAADRIREILAVLRDIGSDASRLTVLLAERINEWNVASQSIAAHISSEYELRYLSETEIKKLIDLLAEHRALGTLDGLSREKQTAAFVQRAGRQLLVALHEATQGERFEAIIENEYNNIRPAEAQNIYLSICVLNRLNVPVRAGMIARVHGVSFEQFKERLFSPLEKVVEAKFNPVIRDYVYRARHPEIAEIVFQRVLKTGQQRQSECLKCLRQLNIDYNVDRVAFSRLVRGRSLLEVFSDDALVKEIYAAAEERVGEEPFLLQQMAVYEMNRDGGDMQHCGQLLRRALELRPKSRTIRHSFAEYCLRAADTARTPLEREKYLDEAGGICTALKSGQPEDAYGHHTLVKTDLRRLRAVLAAPDAVANLEDAVTAIVDRIEATLRDGLQRFPGDSFLLGTEAEYANVVMDSGRARRALEQSFAANPRSAFVAMRLAECYRAVGDFAHAGQVLETALEARRTDRRLHYAYARLLMAWTPTQRQSIAYHLERSFQSGDTNYDAALLYARQLFINGEYDMARAAFAELQKAPVPQELRNAPLYALDDAFYASVSRVEATYCFVQRDGVGDKIYINRSAVSRDVEARWSRLVFGMRVTFRIGFNVRGPTGFDMALID